MTQGTVKETIAELKDNRALGVDGIPTRLIKNASNLFYEKLTDLVNECLREGTTPNTLNEGRMTLIDKKSFFTQSYK